VRGAYRRSSRLIADRWPSDDRRSRLVFIARDLPREFAEALLDAIEAGVRETTRERRAD
jgi:cobalamin synthesis protein cobW-like protein